MTSALRTGEDAKLVRARLRDVHELFACPHAESAAQRDHGHPRAGARWPDRLAVELSEVELGISTVRAEMSRLRAVLGDGLLDSRPYALRQRVGAEFTAAGELLAEGRVHEALSVYSGPLLSSCAPAVEEHRVALEQRLRGTVLASDDAGLLRRWVNTDSGTEDAVAWQALAAHLPRGASRGAAAARARGATAPSGSVAASRPAGSGPTATTSTPRGRPSAATSTPASAGRPTR